MYIEMISESQTVYKLLRGDLPIAVSNQSTEVKLSMTQSGSFVGDGF